MNSIHRQSIRNFQIQDHYITPLFFCIFKHLFLLMLTFIEIKDFKKLFSYSVLLLKSCIFATLEGWFNQEKFYSYKGKYLYERSSDYTYIKLLAIIGSINGRFYYLARNLSQK